MSSDEEGPSTSKKQLTSTECKKHRQRKYRVQWEADKRFKKRLQPDINNQYKAKCRMCNVSFTAEIQVLKRPLKINASTSSVLNLR